MTRRARGKTRVPGLDAYIRRATLGLPREERLDAAAELRTHLLERVAEHQTQGFSREEAEYLAVKGMGEANVTNRQLLGHFLTTPLGWGVVALLIAGWVGWNMLGDSAQAKVRWSGPVDINAFGSGGVLPSYYAGYDFTTPPGTRFMEVAWIGTLGHQRAVLPTLQGSKGQIIFSWPTWREWWATRTPLPYADQPWRSTCREQQPVHVQLKVQQQEGQFAGLRTPNSNLSGVLWCSGIGVPLSSSDNASTGGSSGRDASSGAAEVRQSDNQSDQGRLRLNHWTTIYAFQQGREVTRRNGVSQQMGGEAILVIRPSNSEQTVPLPTFTYTDSRWDVREVAP
ncbi:DUF1707 domain-containing protein [Deinococcus saxicola]|uniref:permease prefix domain 1-containing protein n=1 Tax=Deinococcus saxicola TaxID=249406 RepID=UPI0039EF5C8B